MQVLQTVQLVGIAEPITVLLCLDFTASDEEMSQWWQAVANTVSK